MTRKALERRIAEVLFNLNSEFAESSSSRRRPRPRESRSFRNQTNRTTYLQDIGLFGVTESQCTEDEHDDEDEDDSKFRNLGLTSQQRGEAPAPPQPQGLRGFWPGALLLVGQKPQRVFSLLAPRTQPKFSAALLYEPQTWCTSPKNSINLFRIVCWADIVIYCPT